MLLEQTVTWLEMRSRDERGRVWGEPAGLIELETRPGHEAELRRKQVPAAAEDA